MNNFDIFAIPLNGSQIIDASAGTGKTYTICGLVLRLLLERKLAIDQILVVTYTEAATEDLRNRIRERLRETQKALAAGETNDPFLADLLQGCSGYGLPAAEASRLVTSALRNFDEAPVCTIHSFCQRVLREHSLESGTLFDTELLTDEKGLREEITMDFWRKTFYRNPSLFTDYASDRITPASLLRFLDNTLKRPGLTIIPATGQMDCHDISEPERLFRATFTELCQAWSAAREEVTRILLHGECLHRGRYSKKRVKGWLAAMDILAADAYPSPALFDGFAKFTASELQASSKKNQPVPGLPFFDLCERVWLARQQMLDRFILGTAALKKDFAAYARREMDSRKSRRNIFTFDDLLTRLQNGLAGKDGRQLAASLARQFPAALIDEFQDTDPIQYSIFHSIYSSADNEMNFLLMMIGDPKQAIYSFRGADIFTYIRAAKNTAANRTHTLTTNWRSTPGLIRAVNTLFSHGRTPFIFKEILYHPIQAASRESDTLLVNTMEQPPFHLWFLEPADRDENAPLSKETARQRIIRSVAAEIVRLLNKGTAGEVLLNNAPLLPKDIAVLVRTNREAGLMQQHLTECGVPSVVHNTESIFSSPEAGTVELVAKAIADPGNRRKIRAALATDLLGVSSPVIHRLFQDSDLDADAEILFAEWYAEFSGLYELWRNEGFMSSFNTFLVHHGVRARLLSFPGGERSLTNIQHLVEILHRAAVDNHLGIAGLLAYLADRRANPDTDDTENQLRLESDADCMRIVTIHKAKGLEYPVVFCPFSWEGSRLAKTDELFFHRESATPEGHQTVLDIGSPAFEEHRRIAVLEEMAENLRLLYVALTRARLRCYLVWGRVRDAETSAPAFLFHQPPDPDAVPSLSAALLLDAVARRVRNSDQALLRADLEKIAAAAAGTIHLTSMPETEQPAFYSPPGRVDQSFRPRPFKGELTPTWKTTSYSGMIHGLHSDMDLPDHDQRPAVAANDQDNARESQQPARDIFTFPHGAGPGIFLHDLLEHLDFTCPDPREYITERLMASGFNPDWRDTLSEMITNLLNTPLCPPGDSGQPSDLLLSRISGKQRLDELEFYFPLSQVTVKDLQQVFTAAGSSAGSKTKSFDRNLHRLRFSPTSGFLKGFIDLVFAFEDRYYLVDWKSNHLGACRRDYHQERLAEVMADEFYTLQYHLYTVALHQYLATRIPAYQYRRHFGGVFYIFLRGINRNWGPEFGIYRDLPGEDLINTISAAFMKNQGTDFRLQKDNG